MCGSGERGIEPQNVELINFEFRRVDGKNSGDRSQNAGGGKGAKIY